MQKQINPHNEFGPNAEAPVLTGNKAAAEQAAKISATLTESEADALLLAERNAVLDAAIERLGNGERWTTGALANNPMGQRLDRYIDASDRRQLTTEFARIMREQGGKFCLIGAIGAEEGLHSHEAIDQAVSAVSTAAGINNAAPAYGYTNGAVYRWSDGGYSGRVLAALKAAKSQPLRK